MAESDGAFYEVAWLGLELSVPRDWEIVRHSVSPARGSLIFVDRRRQRLEIGWLAVKSEPDLEHWARDLDKEERRKDSGARLRELRYKGGWRALERTTTEGDVSTRAARYEAESRQLIEVVIETRQGVAGDGDLVETVLQRVRATSSPDRARRVRAFDLAVEAPEPLRFCGAEVKPADVRFDFVGYDRDRDRELKSSASVRRMGMAESWYNGDAEALIRSRETSSTFSRSSALQVAGHEATLAEGLEVGPIAKRALGLLRERRVLLWRCPERNALFAVSTLSSKQQLVEPAAFVVQCCEG